MTDPENAAKPDQVEAVAAIFKDRREVRRFFGRRSIDKTHGQVIHDLDPSGPITDATMRIVETIPLANFAGEQAAQERAEQLADEYAAQAAIAAMQPADDRYRLMLLDLLAIIHRDGGHKTQEMGVKLAWEQAMQLSAERIAAMPAQVVTDDALAAADNFIEWWLGKGGQMKRGELAEAFEAFRASAPFPCTVVSCQRHKRCMYSPCIAAPTERDHLTDIADMMANHVDNWPAPKKLKTAIALIGKTLDEMVPKELLEAALGASK
jgi:hypothetical protein